MTDFHLLEEILCDLDTISVDEIKQRLEPLIKGMAVEVPIFDPGTFLYRARKLSNEFRKTDGVRLSDLTYPPAHLARLGRSNREGQPVFYASTGKEPIFFELAELATGDELLLSFWQTTEPMMLNNVGYTQYVFEKLGARRPCPRWTATRTDIQATVEIPESIPSEIISLIAEHKNEKSHLALSEYFTRVVEQNSLGYYKLTTAIAELHLGTVQNHELQFAGLLYPSVRMWANGDNVALLPSFADKHVAFRKVVHIRIDSRTASSFNITSLDSAREVDESGALRWLGRLPNWTVQPQQTVVCKVEGGRDSDGDYSTDVNGNQCHWRIVDANTGTIIPAQ